jgi:aryl-alcohol dehydrogenase-like predicted oxidoreductase
MTVVIPTITNQAELREYAGAADVPDLTEDELARVAELYDRNFDLTYTAAASSSTTPGAAG